jgi:hypothetical protein
MSNPFGTSTSSMTSYVFEGNSQTREDVAGAFLHWQLGDNQIMRFCLRRTKSVAPDAVPSAWRR